MKSTLVRVVTILNELKVELISLETEEPNLERVFLHLTGRDLRELVRPRLAATRSGALGGALPFASRLTE